MKKAYSIRTAAQLSGLTPYVIRSWENRYNVVSPRRSEGNQRMYSDADVARLKYLSDAVKRGHKIGALFQLENDRIADLAAVQGSGPAEGFAGEVARMEEFRLAISELDSARLDAGLSEAVAEMGLISTIDRLIKPLMDDIGEGWHTGRWGIHHEHLASSVIRSFFGRHQKARLTDRRAPSAIVAAPSGQMHELGSLSVALVCAAAGYRTIYLGPNLPASEIVKAARRVESSLVLLSIVFPETPSRVRSEVAYLRRRLPEGSELVLGGSSAGQFQPVASIYRPQTMSELFGRLSRGLPPGGLP